MSLWACLCHWTPQDLDLGQMHFYWCFQAPLPFALLHSMLVLAAFSRQDAKMLCPSPLRNILRLGGHSVFALQGRRSCSSSRFVDVLIPRKPATQFGCLWRVFSDSLNTLAAGGAREPLILSTGSRTRQQFEGIGIFDSTAQGRDSSNQHFCGKTYLRWDPACRHSPTHATHSMQPQVDKSAQTGPQDHWAKLGRSNARQSRNPTSTIIRSNLSHWHLHDSHTSQCGVATSNASVEEQPFQDLPRWIWKTMRTKVVEELLQKAIGKMRQSWKNNPTGRYF